MLLAWQHRKAASVSDVSISALSDRGLLRTDAGTIYCRHDVSISALSDRGLLQKQVAPTLAYIFEFQYPLFRIVDCFFAAGIMDAGNIAFQYPLFRIVDCFYKPDAECMFRVLVSISALSDRGLLPAVAG